MDPETLEMFQSSVRQVLLEKDDAPLSDRLDTLGWSEIVADDAPTAWRVLFETRGRLLSSADALGPLLAHSLQPATAAKPATVLVPASLHPDRPSATVTNGRLVIDGYTCNTPTPGATLVVPISTEGRTRLALIGGGAAWSTDVEEGMDPSLPVTRISGECPESDAHWLPDHAAGPAWSAATATARWALAAELTAIGQHVVAEAAEYAAQRKQFRRPIGTFQALQHRLASAHAAVVGATEVMIEASHSGDPWSALIAKALAGRAAENCCTQAQQIYGGIGFTWEHGFHRYLRRTYILDRLFGDWRTLEWEIGSALLTSRLLPKIGSL
jgi:Acyl-CoA dehydrogenase, C-terminal domain